mgnify:CR=1 FL=1
MKIHQGDVILEPIKELPTGAKLIRKNIVMYGEITGHAHTIEGAEIYEKDGICYVKVTEKQPMFHTDHPATPPVEEMIYKRRIQKEYFPDGSRQVKE